MQAPELPIADSDTTNYKVGDRFRISGICAFFQNIKNLCLLSKYQESVPSFKISEICAFLGLPRYTTQGCVSKVLPRYCIVYRTVEPYRKKISFLGYILGEGASE